MNEKDKEILKKVAEKYNLIPSDNLPDLSDPRVLRQIDAAVLNEAFKDIACCCGAKFRNKERGSSSREEDLLCCSEFN